MKKIFLSKLLIALMVINVLSVSLTTFSKQNSAYAITSEEEEEDGDDIDPGTIAALASAAVAATVGLFCPKTPQNRCKRGTCQSGACISFRSSCDALGSSCGS